MRPSLAWDQATPGAYRPILHQGACSQAIRVCYECIADITCTYSLFLVKASPIADELKTVIHPMTFSIYLFCSYFVL